MRNYISIFFIFLHISPSLLTAVHMAHVNFLSPIIFSVWDLSTFNFYHNLLCLYSPSPDKAVAVHPFWPFHWHDLNFHVSFIDWFQIYWCCMLADGVDRVCNPAVKRHVGSLILPHPRVNVPSILLWLYDPSFNKWSSDRSGVSLTLVWLI